MKPYFSPSKEKEICKLYFEDELGSNRLAEQFQCHHTTIGCIIKRNGFKMRSKSEAGKGRLGAKNSNWKGGRKYHGDGYICILKPNHPNADRWGYILEHRLIMEKHLGRFLNPKEVVHHINAIKDDNRFENLKLFKNDSEHRKWESKGKKQSQLLRKDFCDILNHSHRKQMVLDAEAEVRARIKEPWEMTQKEFRQENMRIFGETKVPFDWSRELRLGQALDKIRYQSIRNAIEKSKPVPKEVLAEYRLWMKTKIALVKMQRAKEKVEADEKEKEKEK